MSEQNRQFGLLVCGLSIVAAAAWFTAVKPMAGGLATERQRLLSDRAEIEHARSNFDPSGTSEAIGAIERHTGRWRDLWAVCDDASGLYDRFQTLAHATGVRIERVEPKPSGTVLRNKIELHEMKIDATVTGYRVDVQGEYDAVVRFVRGVQAQTGLTRIDTVRLAPAPLPGAESTIEASITTTHAGLAGALAEAAPKGGR